MLAEIFAILFELGWTTKEMQQLDLFLLGMSEARGNFREFGKAVPIPKRSARELTTDRHSINDVPNLLRQGGWTEPEVMAVRLFIKHVHLSDKRIMEMRKMQIMERQNEC